MILPTRRRLLPASSSQPLKQRLADAGDDRLRIARRRERASPSAPTSFSTMSVVQGTRRLLESLSMSSWSASHSVIDVTAASHSSQLRPSTITSSTTVVGSQRCSMQDRLTSRPGCPYRSGGRPRFGVSRRRWARWFFQRRQRLIEPAETAGFAGRAH